MDDPQRDLLAHLRDHDVACPKCSYNLRGTGKLECPECGASVKLADLVRHEPLQMWWIGCLIAVAMSFADSAGYWLHLIRFGQLPSYGGVWSDPDTEPFQYLSSNLFWLSQLPLLIVLIVFRRRVRRVPEWIIIAFFAGSLFCALWGHRRYLFWNSYE